jgi:thioredoxin-related protein
MKKISLIIVLAVVCFFTASCQKTDTASSKVNWMSVQQAIEQAQKDGDNAKLIFIDCYTSWCGWCKVLDQKSFSNDTVAAILNYYFYPCKFNAEGSEVITINGESYNPTTRSGKAGTHELMKVIWEGQRGGGYPTISIRHSDFTPIDCIMGFLGPDELQMALVYYAEKYNRQMSFEKFKSNYEDKYRPMVVEKIFAKK